MTDPISIETDVVDGDVLVIRVRGDLDSFTTKEFEKQIAAHLDAGRTKVIIDCTFLGFISSVGIGALVALQTRLRRRGGTVKLAAVQGPTAEVLRLVRLDKVLDMHGDLEFARKSFREESDDASRPRRP